MKDSKSRDCEFHPKYVVRIFRLDNVEGNPPITIKKKKKIIDHKCHQESDKENLFSDTRRTRQSNLEVD